MNRFNDSHDFVSLHCLPNELPVDFLTAVAARFKKVLLLGNSNMEVLFMDLISRGNMRPTYSRNMTMVRPQDVGGSQYSSRSPVEWLTNSAISSNGLTISHLFVFGTWDEEFLQQDDSCSVHTCATDARFNLTFKMLDLFFKSHDPTGSLVIVDFSQLDGNRNNLETLRTNALGVTQYFSSISVGTGVVIGTSSAPVFDSKLDTIRWPAQVMTWERMSKAKNIYNSAFTEAGIPFLDNWNALSDRWDASKDGVHFYSWRGTKQERQGHPAFERVWTICFAEILRVFE